ncbi:MAG: hypothetical protein QW103_02130 [Candidatus Pacearchaeota archaeon]
MGDVKTLGEENVREFLFLIYSHPFLESIEKDNSLEKKFIESISQIEVPKKRKPFWFLEEALNVNYFKEKQRDFENSSSYSFSYKDLKNENCEHLLYLRFFCDSDQIKRNKLSKRNRKKYRDILGDMLAYSSEDVIEYIRENTSILYLIRNSYYNFSACFKYEKRWFIEGKKYVCSTPLLTIPSVNWMTKDGISVFLLSFSEDLMKFRVHHPDHNFLFEKISKNKYENETGDQKFNLSNYFYKLMKQLEQK